MRRLILIASIWAVTFAMPEMYKESEDFQYSRSSTDEGSKSGFYGAQRGNMGGNYERAHNMDGLAQHQMSTAVRQVEGELGEGAKTRTGSVYTAANSRGIFGSGNYDLSNLKGRNFEESGSFGDLSSHSSLTSQNTDYRNLNAENSAYRSGYTKSSKHISGFQSADFSGRRSSNYEQNENARADNLQQANNQYSYGQQAASGKYYTEARQGAHLQNAYDSNTYGRRTIDNPVRVVMRPGSIVTVPVYSQAYEGSTYRNTHSNQNSVNSEVEELSNSDNHRIYVKPGTIYYTKPKHYESSYRYQKEWEKHDSEPVGITTDNPFSRNNDLFDDTLLLQNAKRQYNSLDSSSAHTSNSNFPHSTSAKEAHSSSYGVNTKASTVSKSKYSYGSQQQNAAATGRSSGYTLGTQATGSEVNANDFVNSAAVENSQEYTARSHGVGSENNLDDIKYLNSKPKSYQSSYSYHKSWERRGDPYVIKPVSGDLSGQTSQKLISASDNQGAYSSQQYGSLYNQAHRSLSQNGVDCDENGHIRVARSANPRYGNIFEDQQQSEQNFEQNLQGDWETSNKLQQHPEQAQGQYVHLEDLGQQTENKWDQLQDFGQQTQLEFQEQQQNVGQETQNEWDKLEKNYEESPNTQQQIQDSLPPFMEVTKDRERVVPVQTVNQEVGREKQKVNSGDNVWEQKNYTTYSYFTNDKKIQEQLEIQKKLISTMYDLLNKGVPSNQYTGAEFYKPVSGPSSEETLHQYHNYQNAASSQNSYHDWSSNNNGKRLSWHTQHNNHRNSNNDDSPLQNVWNKLDIIGSQSGLNINNSDEDTFYNSQSVYKDSSESKWDLSHSTQTTSILGSSPNDNVHIISTTKSVNNDEASTSGKSPSQIPFKTSEITTTEKSMYNLKPVDIGRGDIGADETVEPNPDDVDKINPVPKTYYKTQEEIESLSLYKPIKHTDSTISLTTPIREQTSTTTIKTTENKETKNNDINIQKSLSHILDELKNQNIGDSSSADQQKVASTFNSEEQNTNQQLENFDQNLESSSSIGQTVQNSRDPNAMQINTDKQLEDFGQNHESSLNLGQEVQNPWEPNEKQISTDQQLEDFGQNLQSSSNLGQEVQYSWDSNAMQVNTDQQLEDFGQNLESSSNSGQEVQNFWEPNAKQISTDQQLQDFGQNLESLTNLEQEVQNSWDPNGKQISTDQQLEDFGQNLQSFSNSGQEVQNSWDPNAMKINTDQQLEDFGQNLESSSNLGQVVQNFWEPNAKQISTDQQLQDFDQNLESSSYLEQEGQNSWEPNQKQKNTDQQLQDFGQNFESSSNLGQEVQNFWEPNAKQISTDQQLQDFGQNIESLTNLGQEVQNSWEPNGKQISTDQQLEDFGQNLESSSYLGQEGQNSWEPNEKQKNADQQLEDVGQHFENSFDLEQQSKNFWKPEDNYELQPRENFAKKGNNVNENNVPVIEDQARSIKLEQQLSSPNAEEIPEEVTTEKPSFWNSIGSKFKSAKNSVVSWFKSS